MPYLSGNDENLPDIKKERETLKKERLVALAVTAPLMIYAAIDKKPPKLLKALTLAVAVDLIFKNMKKLNVDNGGVGGENKKAPRT